MAGTVRCQLPGVLRADYVSFLEAALDGYEVSEQAGQVAAAFGLLDDVGNSLRLSWIMLDPGCHGAGFGSALMALRF